MAKAKTFEWPDLGKKGVVVRCPGCRMNHYCVSTIHTFNGNFEHPTLSPSLKQEFGTGEVCHSYVEDGKIRFLDDTTRHSLRGPHELPEIE